MKILPDLLPDFDQVIPGHQPVNLIESEASRFIINDVVDTLGARVLQFQDLVDLLLIFGDGRDDGDDRDDDHQLDEGEAGLLVWTGHWNRARGRRVGRRVDRPVRYGPAIGPIGAIQRFLEDPVGSLCMALVRCP